MNVVLLCLGLLLGVCGWGFLAAAVLVFPDTDRSAVRAVPWPVLCLDMMVSLGFSYNSILNTFSVNFAIVPNVFAANYHGQGFGGPGMAGAPGVGAMPFGPMMPPIN